MSPMSQKETPPTHRYPIALTSWPPRPKDTFHLPSATEPVGWVVAEGQYEALLNIRMNFVVGSVGYKPTCMKLQRSS